jgi:hypothetical protein
MSTASVVPIVIRDDQAVRFLCKTCDEYIAWADLVPLSFQGAAALYHETAGLPPLPCGPVFAETAAELSPTIITLGHSPKADVL